VYFASLDEEGVASLIGHGRVSFIIKREHSFLDVNNYGTRMRVPALATSGRNFDRTHNGLIVVYEVVATRIIEAAEAGERDPDKLRDWALTAFGGKKG